MALQPCPEDKTLRNRAEAQELQAGREWPVPGEAQDSAPCPARVATAQVSGGGASVEGVPSPLVPEAVLSSQVQREV